EHGFSVLETAVDMGHLEVAKTLLLEHGGVVDVNSTDHEGRTALHNVVIHEWDVDLVDLLLSAGADIDAGETDSGLTALHYAAQLCGSDMAAVLLQRGAARDPLSSRALTPLYYAVRDGNLTATCALLTAGADPTLRDPYHMSPLDVTAYEGRVEVIRELARQGADVDAAPASGWTALHWAAKMNQAGSVTALVEAGASIDLETEVDTGSTPLYRASATLALDAARALLRHGA
ncbi:unnamed protein product, partial [Laminaria digitata]